MPRDWLLDEIPGEERQRPRASVYPKSRGSGVHLSSNLGLPFCEPEANPRAASISLRTAELQTDSSQTAAFSTENETTVQGCRNGSDGNYILTDKNGSTFHLTGDAGKLSEHVGPRGKGQRHFKFGIHDAEWWTCEWHDATAEQFSSHTSYLRQTCIQDVSERRHTPLIPNLKTPTYKPSPRLGLSSQTPDVSFPCAAN